MRTVILDASDLRHAVHKWLVNHARITMREYNSDVPVHIVVKLVEDPQQVTMSFVVGKETGKKGKK